jgi:hypothetical protein
MTIEYFPYRSLSDDYRHESLSLPSQDYCRLLVMNAMSNEAVIVVRYGKSRWFDAVRGLKNYSLNRRTLRAFCGRARSAGR